ncbi:MAG: LysR family transcriptional regulator [Solirubrobacterales bacterium]
MLDVKRLRILREVAARGSFSAAAEELYLSQSAVSQQVATLEREVGMTLLERTSAGPKLTDAGSALVTHVDAVICRLEEAERELAAIAGLEGGRLRLVSFPTASATLVTRAVSSFRERHPAVELQLGEAEPDQSVPALKRGEYDLALTYDYAFHPDPEDRDTHRTLLLEEEMQIALPPEHRLAKRAAVKLGDLADDDWLTGVSSGSCRTHVILLCQQAGFEPRISFESDDYQVLQGLVSAGVGVSLLPELALAGRHAEVVTRPLAGKAPVRRVWATTLAAGSRAPATDAMLQVLAGVAERFRAGALRAVA